MIKSFIVSIIANRFVAVIIAGVVALGTLLFKAKRSGAKEERAKWKESQLKGKQANDKTIKAARDARDNVDSTPGGELSDDDGFRRD